MQCIFVVKGMHLQSVAVSTTAIPTFGDRESTLMDIMANLMQMKQSKMNIQFEKKVEYLNEEKIKQSNRM